MSALFHGVTITKKLNLNLSEQSTVRAVCMRVCISLCTTAVHNTAENGSDNLPSYNPGSHHCSDVIYWRRECTG